MVCPLHNADSMPMPPEDSAPPSAWFRVRHGSSGNQQNGKVTTVLSGHSRAIRHILLMSRILDCKSARSCSLNI